MTLAAIIRTVQAWSVMQAAEALPLLNRQAVRVGDLRATLPDATYQVKALDVIMEGLSTFRMQKQIDIRPTATRVGHLSEVEAQSSRGSWTPHGATSTVVVKAEKVGAKGRRHLRTWKQWVSGRSIKVLRMKLGGQDAVDDCAAGDGALPHRNAAGEGSGDHPGAEAGRACQLSWGRDQCRIEHAKYGKIPVQLIQGWPHLDSTWGSFLLQEVERRFGSV